MRDEDDLNECSHLSSLFTITSSIVEDNIRCPDPLPGQPGVCDVVVLGGVPHQEHVMPLGDDLTVGCQGLGSLILYFINSGP